MRDEYAPTAVRDDVAGYLFTQQARSERSTILETAKLHAVDPAAYLAAAVRAADRGEVLLPWQFAVTPR